MKFYIRNMVCPRCIAAVKRILTSEGLHPRGVILGEAEVEEDSIDADTLGRVRQALEDEGFSLLEDENSRIVSAVKAALVDAVWGEGIPSYQTLSAFVEEKLPRKSFAQVSALFSQTEGKTLERYYISLKIERAKELLSYGDCPANEIAYELGYSSPAHFSSQFKQATGVTPKEFRLTHPHRSGIDKA